MGHEYWVPAAQLVARQRPAMPPSVELEQLSGKTGAPAAAGGGVGDLTRLFLDE